MKKWIVFSLIVVLLLIIGCGNIYKKTQVSIKDINDDYIYVAEIKSEEVTRIMYNIERDDKLKKEKLSIGDILEIEYQVKERSKPPLIKLKSFKVLPRE